MAGELYRAWASETQRERTLAIVFTPEGGWERDHSEPAIELAGFKALVSKIESEAVDLEKALGPLVDPPPVGSRYRVDGYTFLACRRPQYGSC